MPRGKQELYSKEQVTLVADMYLEGKSLSDIAATTKIGHSNLYRILHKAKVPLRGRNPAPAATKAKAERQAPATEPETAAIEPEVSRARPGVQARLREAQRRINELERLVANMMLGKKR